jgi:hypothetical protein
MPGATKELRAIVDEDMTYAQLYALFEIAYDSADAPNVWYQNNIIDGLKAIAESQ